MDEVGTIFNEFHAIDDEIKKILASFHDEDIEDGMIITFLFQLNQSMLTNDRELAILWETRFYLWEQLHAVHWEQTPIILRNLFGIITTRLVIRNFISFWGKEEGISLLKRLIHVCDIGLLLSSPETHRYLHTLIDTLQALLSSKECISVPEIRQSLSYISPIPRDSDSLNTYIGTLDSNNIQTFYENFFITQTPIILKGVMNDWDAFQKWNRIEYLLEVASERTVPIELGSSYLSNNSSMKLMTLREFVLSYILCQDNGVGYLAQHTLFDQIPQLKKDFYIPDQCSFLLEKDEECSDVLIQSWFGPIGTVSPLHYDAYHNILAQVVGYKFIRLYHPEYSSQIQPMDGKLKNNSSIDLSTSCDELKDVPHYDILLAPGDCLFLPRWWWHYITSVDESTAQQLLGQHPSVRDATDQSIRIQYSFSINFWWGKRIEAPF